MISGHGLTSRKQSPQENTVTYFRQLCAELLHAVQSYLLFTDVETTTAEQRAKRLDDAMSAVRTALALAHPEPAGEVTDDEILALKSWSGSNAFESDLVSICRAAIALYRSRRARPVAEDSSVAQPAEGEVAELVRYGVDWNGIPANPLLVPKADGYWTPWHTAAALLHPHQPPQPVQAAEGDVATIAARLKELSRAVTEQRWQEFSMRIPAEPLRDADLVMARAAALLQHHQPPQPVAVGERLPAAVAAELAAARAKFPEWPTDPLHAVAIVTEEVGELSAAALQVVYEPGKAIHVDVVKEAIQVAAVALRFVESLQEYVYPDSTNTHRQSGSQPTTPPEAE
jgi:hypothetical protein